MEASFSIFPCSTRDPELPYLPCSFGDVSAPHARRTYRHNPAKTDWFASLIVRFKNYPTQITITSCVNRYDGRICTNVVGQVLLPMNFPIQSQGPRPHVHCVPRRLFSSPVLECFLFLYPRSSSRASTRCKSQETSSPPWLLKVPRSLPKLSKWYLATRFFS